jgi:hypothetical protein
VNSTIHTGTLHIFVAYDWGDEIDLERARQLVPGEVDGLPRRRRTPTSIAYRPPPLRFRTAPVQLSLPEVGQLNHAAEVTVFDFAAISVALRIPFSLGGDALTRLADCLADPSVLLGCTRRALQPIYTRLLLAIHDPVWQDNLSEEYFVFQLYPAECPAGPDLLHSEQARWLAGLLRLEVGTLSEEEVAEALRLHISYSPKDLLIPDWASAVLIDQDCEETLRAIEFANLQLLEFRHIDNRLDESLAAADRMSRATSRPRFPFSHRPSRTLRLLGELKVEANTVFERTGNVLKLVGDQYLARVYRLMAKRLHLEEWEQSIRRKLDVTEGIYRVVSDQTDTYRTEFLEMIIIFLILLELILAVVRH